MSKAPGSAYDLILTTLRQYGLASLAPAVLTFLQDGYTQDQVSVLIQDTPEYKERFSGNELRRKAGLPALSPRDYLNVEAGYRQVLSTYGMPTGFYDSPSDFAAWIGADVSASEIQQRVTLAVDAADKMDNNLKMAFQNWYGVGSGDLAAFFLDQDRALPHIQKIAKATTVGAAASREGLAMDRERAEYLGTLAGSRDIDSLVGQVADASRRGNALSDIYGGADYRQGDAESEVFAQSEAARRKRLALAAQEEASFGGSSGVGRSTLGKNVSNI